MARAGAITGTALNKGMRNEIAASNSTGDGSDTSTTSSESAFLQDFGTETTSSWTTTFVGTTLSKSICDKWFKDPTDGLDGPDKDIVKKLLDKPDSRDAKAMRRLFKQMTPRLIEDSLKDNGIHAAKVGFFADEMMEMVNLVDCFPGESIANLPETLGQQISDLAEQQASGPASQGVSTALKELAKVPASMNADVLPSIGVISSVKALEQMMNQLAWLNQGVAVEAAKLASAGKGFQDIANTLGSFGDRFAATSEAAQALHFADSPESWAEAIKKVATRPSDVPPKGFKRAQRMKAKDTGPVFTITQMIDQQGNPIQTPMAVPPAPVPVPAVPVPAPAPPVNPPAAPINPPPPAVPEIEPSPPVYEPPGPPPPYEEVAPPPPYQPEPEKPECKVEICFFVRLLVS
jgi:hypothetical protein